MDFVKLEASDLPAPLFVTHQKTRYSNRRLKYLTVSAVKNFRTHISTASSLLDKTIERRMAQFHTVSNQTAVVFKPTISSALRQ
jgi:hypothetical protein